MTRTAEAAGPRRRRATIHGAGLAYEEYSGVGVPLVLLHGVGSSARNWQDAAAALAETGRTVVSIDLPGHGDSDDSGGDFSLGSMASAVRDLLDHLGLDRVVLVGHSLGGGVALQFQYQYPSRMAGLVLVSSGGLGRETNMILRLAALPGSGMAIRLALNERTMSAAHGLRERARNVLRKPDLIPDQVMDRIDRLASEDSRTSFLATLRSVVDHRGQRVSALDKLHLTHSLPVLIVWGRKDAIIPVEHGENAHSLLPQSRLVVFDDAGHEPHRRDPERFARVVRQWLADSKL
ncbi:MAG: alpha/beta fold hydrolase [Candidatus Nanopelagicales bacterium]